MMREIFIKIFLKKTIFGLHSVEEILAGKVTAGNEYQQFRFCKYRATGLVEFGKIGLM